MKKQNKKIGKKVKSIKVKLVIIPLIVVLFVISGIGIISSTFTKKSLISEMESNGLKTTEEFASRLEDNANSLDIINALLENKIRSIGSVIKLSKDNLNNEFLKQIANESGIHEINYYSSDGEITSSNVDDYVGFKLEEGHPAFDFLKSNDKELLEKIRQDNVSGDFVKFGYFRSENGEFVQVGMMADEIQALTDNLDYQKLIEELGSDDSIEYSLLVNKDLTAIAHSNKDEVGDKFDDESIKTAAIDAKPYAGMYTYEGVTAYDVCYPVTVNGEHFGAIVVGYSMDNIEATIAKNMNIAIISAVVAFILLGFVLYSSSNDAVKVINNLKERMEFMASGDFSIAISDDVTVRNDEFGEISRSVATMQDSMKSIIANVVDTSEQLGLF